MWSYAVHGAVWLVLYLLFILAPLFAMLAGTLPPARDFWTEFAVALGYSGLAMMGLQFGLTARFRFVTRPWGEDVIYHFHRQISLIAVAFVFAHPLIIFAAQPELLARPEDGSVPIGALAAVASIGALALLVVTALWRVRLKIGYELWHASHIVLALVAVGGGIVHMVGWSFYLEDPRKRALWIGLVAVLGAAAAVRAGVQAAVHAAPALPHRGGAARARRHHDAGDGARRPCRLSLHARAVRLADAVARARSASPGIRSRSRPAPKPPMGAWR